MYAVVTADIILLPLLIAGIAVAIAVIEYLDLCDARKRAKKAEGEVEWWVGMFLRLAAAFMREDGYKIRVEPGGKITLIRASEAPGKTGAAKGSIYPWKAPQKTGQTPDDKKGESMADRHHDDLFGSTLPTSILSELRGPETKNPSEIYLDIDGYWRTAGQIDRESRAGRTDSDR